MSARGSLNTRNITLATREVLEWYKVGVALNIEPYKLKEIEMNNRNSAQHCKFSLIDLWLRTDVTASWSKLAAALDEAGEEAAAGKIKEQYLGIPASSPIPPAVVAATGAAGVGRAGAGLVGGLPHPGIAQQRQSQPVMANLGIGGSIAADGPPAAAHSAPVPVPISAQAPVTSVNEAVRLLKTTQEGIISGLTHGTLDVNFAGANPQGMTLMHYAAMQGAETECLKALIAFGANVNPLNAFGQTPLDLASMATTMEGDMVRVLEEVGGVSGVALTQGQQPVGQMDVIQNPDFCNILSLSSSGPYCIVQLETIQQVEVHSGRKVTDCFQWIVASGFGALFLLLIVYGNKTMADVKRLYFKLREEVFCQPDMARRSQALDGFLQAHLGTQMKMSDTQQPRMLIGALYKGSTKVETHLFNNCFQDQYSVVPVWKVARYTCSLPLNIMESDNYTSTDPALANLSSVGLRRIRQFYRDIHQDPDVIGSLVCVEAGQFNAQELGCVDMPATALSSNPQWFSSQGALNSLTQLLTLHQSSALAAGEECVLCCREQCERYRIQFHHFNPLLIRHAPLLLDVSLKDVVDSVIESISQVSGKPMDSLIAFLNNNM